MPGAMKRRDDRNEPGPWARVMMGASALVVAALFAYMAYHAVTAPRNGEPGVEVVASAPTASGDLRVEVAVTNQAERGLREIVVEVTCGEPPPQLTLANIPAQGQRRGIVHCPPDATNLTAGISSYAWT